MSKVLEHDHLTTRRDWLFWLIGVLTCVLGSGTLTAIAAYLVPARKKGAAVERVEVAGAKELNPGQSKIVMGPSGPVIVVRGKDRFVALSATCTHLGCLVKFDPTRELFVCPCHGGRFDLDGRRVAGPPPRPLKQVPLSIVDGRVFLTV